MRLRHLPRVHLACLPTPLGELTRLTQVLRGPRLLIKRDDQTGLASGGNKARKLEFTVADALRQGADTLITVGGPQSNHCRQTAAAAAQYGLHSVLILSGDPPPAWNGNLLLDDLLMADIQFLGKRSRQEVVDQVMLEQRAMGRHPYFVPAGASDGIGAAGYVVAMRELDRQLRQRRLHVDRIVVACGSGGTQAGLCAGAKIVGFQGEIVGISVSRPREDLQSIVAGIATSALALFGVPDECCGTDIVVRDEYRGGGYAVMGEPDVEAIRLVASTEGILLDPVYTGRAMAGLIDLIRRNEIGRDETVLFWHTGGYPALFAYPQLCETSAQRLR